MTRRNLGKTTTNPSLGGKIKLVVVTIVLGAIGSGLWDVAVKPGGGWTLTVLTLGSQRVIDSTYRDAAMDPTAIPALSILILISGIPATFAAGILFATTRASKVLQKILRLPDVNEIRDLRRKKTQIQAEGENADQKKRLEEIEGKIETVKMTSNRKCRNMFFWMLIVSTLVGLYTFLPINQSVLIWRKFHANLDICTQYLSDDETKRLKAQFASMRSWADYDEIHTRLRRTADDHKLVLRE